MTEDAKPRKGRNLFQLIVVAWLVILTAVVSITVVNLLQVRAAAETTLAQAAQQLEALRADRIETTVQLDQVVPVSATISIDEDIPVPVSLTVEHVVEVNDEIPFQ